MSKNLRGYMKAVKTGNLRYQREKIFDLLLREGPMTNRMIAKVLNMETASVSARVNALLEDGLLQDAELNRPDPHTGVAGVRWVEVMWPQKAEQLELI